ncbi:MAG: preprotein translocase subunit SecA [Chloroflexi bacterium]|nr:preprotein translocase subunit SecA [Chloroflexota bacterium]
MFKWLGSLLDSNEKQVRKLEPAVEQINELEPRYNGLTDSDLRDQTQVLKQRIADGETLDDLLADAFAAVRESARRAIGQRHFDVQLMGGIILHQGKISEMKTGEGKTLVATLPLYLNSLTGRGCHLVTVNDYLAKRDARWMGPIFHALGVGVATIQHEASFIYDPAFEGADPRWQGLRPVTRLEAYRADITYGTNNEFGFDYLRDNMVVDLSQMVQRPLYYAIVDEVDNILIDEARTPLIISGAAEEPAQKYYAFARMMPLLVKEEDYTVDEKLKTVALTEAGTNKVEGNLRRLGLLKAPSLYDPANYTLTHYLEAALKAQVIFRRDRDYVVKDGQVIIVDEFTGRLMFGRRYSEGLHQAIEAKENVKIQKESVTLATVTFQNYFRMYEKLAGMTGTAATEAEEFHKIYKLEVVVIPTNKAMVRKDHADQVYKSEEGKFRAVVREVESLYTEQRPVLIGTVSIEKSEHLSEMMKVKGIPHQVLNAKYHEKEAAIIAQAGRLGAVTVATNMAGRGVDIILGGSPEARERQDWENEHNTVVEKGGLHIVGTERHEARRIDNQLRGRGGRQGDAGSSRFFVSLEDDIVRRFGGDRIKGLMEWAGMDEETPIEHGMVSKAIENAQVKVEGYHFDMRKHLVDYDDVVNKHREIIYAERKKILSGADLKANIQNMVREEIEALVHSYLLDETGDNWNLEGLCKDLETIFKLTPEQTPPALANLKKKEIADRFIEYGQRYYEEREKEIGAGDMRLIERIVMLRTIDSLWVEHLTSMEQMRQGIGLVAVGHTDPLIAYKKEGHALFQGLLSNIRHDVAHTVFHLNITREPAPSRPRTPITEGRQAELGKRPVGVGGKVGRNDPCPCGSGKKYKKCCGAPAGSKV